MIVCSNTSGPTARLIGAEINRMTGMNLLVRHQPIPGKIIHVNYGCGDDWANCDLNHPDFVRLCCNKYRFSKLLTDNGVRAPVFQRGVPTTFPCVVRETLSSFGGRGMHVVATQSDYEVADLNPNFWWTPFVKTDSEFRIHVLGHKIAKVCKKDYRGEEPELELPIRSHLRGYFFRFISDEKWRRWDKLTALVEKLEQIIPFGGCFYGLDVGYSREMNDWFVFEANSAPGLNEVSVKLYAKYIVDYNYEWPYIGGGANEVLRAGENT
jgi:hypothetical protein